MKFRSILCTALMGASAAGWAQAPAPAAGGGGQPPALPARGPSLELALEAAQATLADCSAKGHRIGVTVVDSAGVTKVTLGADGVSSRGVQSSGNKAVTALTFKLTSAQVGEKIKTDTDLAAKVAANTSFNARAGGVLLQVNGEVIGAIGVGGARGSENDEACALTGVQKIQARLK